MPEPFPGYHHLEGAIEQCVLDNDTPEGSIIIGWAVSVAYRTPEQMIKGDNAVTHDWFVMEGQPPYASVGLFEFASDDMRVTDDVPKKDDD